MALILSHPSYKAKLDDPREPPHPDSAISRALGTARDGICTACGLPTRVHLGVTGTWLGCDVAAYVERQSDQPRNPERWNDPYAFVTARVRAALVDGECGPRMEIDMSHYDNDEQLNVASAIARIAISAYLKGMAK